MNTINKQWGVSIGLVILMVGAAYFVATKLSGIEYKLELAAERDRQQEVNFGYELRTINAKIDFLDGKLEDATTDRWTSADAQSWAGLLQALNPKLNIPEASRQQYRGVDASGNPIHGGE